MAHAPTRAKLIALLIEERAKLIAYKQAFRNYEVIVTDADKDQARREIEQEVLCPR